MRRAMLVVIAVVLTGCASARALELAGPAAPDALSCALGVAVQAGYEPQEGGVSDGYVRLLRHREATAGEVGANVGVRVATMGMFGKGRTEWDVIRVVSAAGRLNVVAWSLNDDEKQVNLSEEGKADAQAILDSCGAR